MVLGNKIMKKPTKKPQIPAELREIVEEIREDSASGWKFYITKPIKRRRHKSASHKFTVGEKIIIPRDTHILKGTILEAGTHSSHVQLDVKSQKGFGLAHARYGDCPGRCWHWPNDSLKPLGKQKPTLGKIYNLGRYQIAFKRGAYQGASPLDYTRGHFAQEGMGMKLCFGAYGTLPEGETAAVRFIVEFLKFSLDGHAYLTEADFIKRRKKVEPILPLTEVEIESKQFAPGTRVMGLFDPGHFEGVKPGPDGWFRIPGVVVRQDYGDSYLVNFAGSTFRPRSGGLSFHQGNDEELPTPTGRFMGAGELEIISAAKRTKATILHPLNCDLGVYKTTTGSINRKDIKI